MITNSLDSIIRNVLLRKGYGMHFYIDALLSSQNCLRELTFDDLQIVNTVELAVDQNTLTANLPNDFMADGDVGVFIKAGQRLRPLAPTNNMNPLIHRVNGVPTPYSDGNQNNTFFNGFGAGYFWRTITWNQFGENVGRLFGYNVGYNLDSYQIFPERNQIQLDESSGIQEVVLMYISDGMTSSAISQITPYAIQTIEAYILWQFKEMNRNYGDGERERMRQLYIAERKVLRARKDELTLTKLKRIVQKSYYGAPKS